MQMGPSSQDIKTRHLSNSEFYPAYDILDTCKMSNKKLQANQMNDPEIYLLNVLLKLLSTNKYSFEYHMFSKSMQSMTIITCLL